MLRADMDALPVEEATGLTMPARSRPLIGGQDGAGRAYVRARHARAWLVGATTIFAQARATWAAR